MNRFAMAVRLFAVVIGAVLSLSAFAATRVINGTLAPGGPTMPVVFISTPNCTGQGTSQVLYRAYAFTVDVGGTYTMSIPVLQQSSLYVHAGTFDPDNSFPTCIAASNTQPISLGVNLVPGTTYFAVVFDDSFAQAGFAFQLNISGPGNIIANCSGLTDVDLGSAFCPSIEWLRNRAITTGCTATQYCPTDPVNRLQMAAFLNRLGNALEPVFRHQSQTAAQAAVNANGIVCQTDAYAIAGFPRVASLSSVTFYHQAASSVKVSTRLVYSLNAGVSWVNFGAVATSEANVGGSTAAQSPAAAPVFLPPGKSVLFGIQTNATAATLTDAGCELTVRLDSHTGASGAFDPASSASSAPAQGPAPSHGP